MKTLFDIILLSEKFLQDRGIARARREAEDLIADALNMRRIDLYLQFERPMVEEELKLCRDFLKRRVLGEPPQYISGKVQFAGAQIEVTRDVLIPRQETEILVEILGQTLKDQDLEGKVLWDLCTGSGCIAIALKKRFPKLVVCASDISPKALEIAKKNALANNVDVQFYLGDLFAPFAHSRCDFFVSNPPYIPQKEFETLPKEVKNFEPTLALIAGEEGLDVYERIARDLHQFLLPGGRAWFEIGYNQGSLVKNLFEKQGWQGGRVEKDWSGHDRFFFLEKDLFFKVF